MVANPALDEKDVKYFVAYFNSTGFVSTLNGPTIRTVAVNGPFALLGSRHESEHVLPHPYLNLNVLS